MQVRPKILLVEDDTLLRNLLRRVLDHAGYDVITATNGHEAVAQYEAGWVDLVLTDIVMPDKEGLETIQELRRRNPGIKIIAMSGGGLIDPQSYLSVAGKIGVAATLQKPFTHEAMLKTVAQLLPLDDPALAVAVAEPASLL